MRHRNILIVLLAVACSYQASAMDVWTFRGACKNSTVKQGPSHTDMNKIQGSVIVCDAGFMMELENGRKLVQFGLKQGDPLPPGFSGGEFKNLHGRFALVLDTLYPQRSVAGKTTEQIYAETTKSATPTEGYCYFSDSDFSKLTEISCTAKTDTADKKMIYDVTFAISDITVKRFNEGANKK